MIPAAGGLLNRSFVIKEQPGKTYKMEIDNNTIRGITDGIEAVKQAIYNILNTERYEYIMYSWNYGIELADLFGEPISYVCPELERRITEALTWDTRITDVTDFEFNTAMKGAVYVTFKVQTIYGETEAEKGVNI